jgi:hypothetical protein
MQSQYLSLPCCPQFCWLRQGCHISIMRILIGQTIELPIEIKTFIFNNQCIIKYKCLNFNKRPLRQLSKDSHYWNMTPLSWSAKLLGVRQVEVVAQHQQVLLQAQLRWNKTITLILFYLLENIKTWDSCGFNTFHLALPPVSMLLICKTNWTRSYKNVRLERQVFVPLEKSSTPKHSMK